MKVFRPNLSIAFCRTNRFRRLRNAKLGPSKSLAVCVGRQYVRSISLQVLDLSGSVYARSSEIVGCVLKAIHGEFDFDKDFFVTFFLGKKVRQEMTFCDVCTICQRA
jgi:hypothetical protein